MRHIFALLILVSCATGQPTADDRPVVTPDELRPTDPDPSTVCDWHLCDYDWQCESECSGPSKCSPARCDLCGGICIALTATP